MNTKKIKACFAQASMIKNDFHDKTCAMPISVGQPYHEGQKILATIELINKYFAKCIIIVCDSLQRYNIYYDKNEMAAYKEAINAGNQWIERNAHFFTQFKIPYELVRWDKWYKHDLFLSYLEKIEKLYHEDNNFMNAVNDCADAFVNQHLMHYNEKIFSQSTEIAKNICKNYLKEEAAILLMWNDCEEYDLLAYPGSNNKVMIIVYEYFIKNSNGTNRLIPLRIKFKK